METRKTFQIGFRKVQEMHCYKVGVETGHSCLFEIFATAPRAPSQSVLPIEFWPFFICQMCQEVGQWSEYRSSKKGLAFPC